MIIIEWPMTIPYYTRVAFNAKSARQLLKKHLFTPRHQYHACHDANSLSRFGLLRAEDGLPGRWLEAP